MEKPHPEAKVTENLVDKIVKHFNKYNLWGGGGVSNQHKFVLLKNSSNAAFSACYFFSKLGFPWAFW